MPYPPDLSSRVLELLEADEPFVLATVVVAHDGNGGSTALPVRVGQKLIVYGNGDREGSLGAAALEEAVAEAAAEVFRSEEIAMVRLSPNGELLRPRLGLRQVGDEPVVEVALEPMLPRPALVIVGAGHIAVPLAKIGKLLGFEVTVLDDRAAFANRERFPEADHVIAADFVAALPAVPMTRWTYVVLVTRGHEHDEACLRLLVDSPAPYIGMIGSRRRVHLVFQRLEAAGVRAAKLDRVYAPIGLDIGAQTPEEIAVAIAAEIVNIRRGGDARSMALRAGGGGS